MRAPTWSVSVAVGAVLVAATTAALVPFRSGTSRAIPALVLVLPIVVTALAGGRGPALLTAVAAVAAFNLGFIPPYWTPKIAAAEDLVALAVFAVAGGTVGTLVAREGDRRKAAEDRVSELAIVNERLVALQQERERLAEEATRATVLERVDAQRAALLRSVSHDLRTPLSSIRAVASDLLSDTDYDADTRHELLSLVADEAERLDRLVANLLSMSRIEAGALQPALEPVPLDELVHHTVRRLQRLLRGVRVQVELPGNLPAAMGDYSQIDQVVSNLLENAARHAPPASIVRVGGRARPDGHEVEVWIDDEGNGIPSFEQERIFEPFQRGDGSTSSGIGLAICKAIVEAHGGRIHATSAPSGGARFAFTLRAAGD